MVLWNRRNIYRLGVIGFRVSDFDFPVGHAENAN